MIAGVTACGDTTCDFEVPSWNLKSWGKEVHQPDDRLMSALIPPERIASAILLLRDERVMLDRDLAQLYGVTTKDFTKPFPEIASDFHQTSCSN